MEGKLKKEDMFVRVEILWMLKMLILFFAISTQTRLHKI